MRDRDDRRLSASSGAEWIDDRSLADLDDAARGGFARPLTSRWEAFLTGLFGLVFLSLLGGGLVSSVALFDSSQPAATASPRHVWQAEDAIRSVCFDSTGRRLVGLDNRGGLSRFDLDSGAIISLGSERQWLTNVIAVSPDGKVVAAAGWSGEILLRDLASGQIRGRIGRADPLPVTEPVAGDRPDFTANSILALAYSNDGGTLAVGTSDGRIRLFDPTDGRLQGEIRAHDRRVTHLVWSKSDRLLVSGSLDGSARVWNRADGRRLKTVRHQGREIAGLALAPDERTLAISFVSSSMDESATLLLTELGEHPRPDRFLGDVAATVLTFTPDGRSLVVAHGDSLIRIWNLATDQLQLVLEGHTGYLRAVACSPDGQWVATASDDTHVGLYRMPRLNESSR